MTKRRHSVVVIGASAGGVQALVTIAEQLPAHFDAAVFVALHLPEGGTSDLATILDRAGPLPAAVAADGVEIEPGTIRVAPPDRHLVLEAGRTRVVRGPKVNGSRPSVDVLFHSAARSWDGRAIGVVLSGMLNDGTLGLRAIKRRDGIAIVQEDPVHEGMPSSAIGNVEIDAVVPSREIAERLTMFLQAAEEAGVPGHDTEDTELEAGFDLDGLHEAPGDPTAFRCPECGGALWELQDNELVSYACHVGHTYSADSMLDENGNAVERAIWTAIRMLEERAALLGRLSDRMGQRGHERSASRFQAKARVADEQATLIRTALLEPSESDESDDSERVAS